MAAAPRILHLLGGFDEGDSASLRLVRLIGALGPKAGHAIVVDDRQRRGAARLLAKSARVSWPRFPPIRGSKLPGRLLKFAAAMRGHDLICTYGSGALDAALAHTLFADVHKLPPLVHHELSADPAELGGRARAWYRRFALGRSAALVVPDRTIETIALEAWDQPRTRVRLIPDGIDTRAFAGPARRDLLPGLIKRRDELWLGTFVEAAGDELPALLRALAELPEQWQLVIVGEPPQRAALEDEAGALAIEDRLHFAAPVKDRAGLLALLDALVLPAPPGSTRALVIEAMAAGLPLVLPRGGEESAPVASDNGPLLLAPDGMAGATGELTEALRRLTADPGERRRIGQANRAKAREEFDERRVVERSWALYGGLTGRATQSAGQGADG